MAPDAPAQTQKSMTWSFTIARISGTEIRIHLTFLMLLAWIAISAWSAAGAAAVVDSVLFILALFACVLLHELGHVLAARRYGITTPDITLLPIGGLARLSRLPENPSEEIVIAMAGPLVNVAIAAVLLLLGARLSVDAYAITDYGQAFISRLAVVNLYLVAFNLIPAFPMDGGRVLRALIALRLGRSRATEIAAKIGQGLALAFGFYGLVSGNVLLVFIAIFVYLAASAEAGHSSLMEMASRLSVDRAMIRVFESLSPKATIGDAADAVLRTTQHEFPVVDGGGRFRGIVTRASVVAALKKAAPTTPVLEVLTEAPSVRTGSRLTPAVRLIMEQGAPVVGVTDTEDRLVGYVSKENLGELLMLGDQRPTSEETIPLQTPR